MEGYEDEDGNYIPGEIENAETEGRQIKFKGNISKADKKAQENYNKEYDEYENLKNYQNQIMNLMQYKLNKKQFGGLNKFVEGGPTDCGEGYKWNEELQECVEDTSKYNEKSYAKHLAEKKIYEDALKEIEVGTTEYAILEEAYNAKVKKLEKEKERVLKVRGNVIPASKALDKADDLIKFSNPFYQDYIYAENPKELALARKALPQEIKNVLPNQGLYNVAKWNSKTNKWNEGLHPSRELYCTPYGCFAYQKAGASDVPTIGGNIDFANRAATGDFAFEKINPNERQPGDMALMVEMSPNDYSDPNSGESRRPHHTTIYAEPDPKFPKDTKKGNFYNANSGSRLNFEKTEFDMNGEPGDRFDYYRYVGAQNKINNEVLDLAKQKEEFNIKQEQRKNNAALPSIPTLKPNLITQNNTATLQYPKKEEKLKTKRKLFKNKSFELGGLHKFVGGGEPCPQGFQEDPVTGECVSTMGQTERVQRIEEVPTNQYSKYITEYEEANPRDAFVYQKKADYLKKNKGLNRQSGLSQDNFPENAENNFNKNWEYNRNSFVINQFAKDHGINPKNHVEIVEKMADKGKTSYDMIAHSKYGSKLQPSFWAKSLAGAQELANFMAKQAGEKGDAFNYQTPGLTKKEWEDIHNSSVGALETASLIDIPGAVIGNSIADLSTASGGNYQESPGILSGELKSNISPFKASLLNPINYVGLINSVSKTQALNKLLLGNLLNPLNYEGKERSLPGSPNAAIDGSSQIPQNKFGGLHRFTDGGSIKGLQGLNADFSTNLTAFINAAKAEGIDLNIGSGFRTAEKQKQLWEQALKKYGSPEKARKWVAPPGKSNHNRGTAVDLHSNGNALGKQKNSKATQWAHANAEKYGLNFRMGHEPWHIEPLNLSKEQKIKIDSEHQHSDSEDPDTHVDPNNIEALSKEGIDMDKYYQNLVKEQETTDIDNDYSNWDPREEVVVDPRIKQLDAYSKLMTPSIQNVNDMYLATKINQQQQKKQFAKGGYIELDANDNDINNYIKDGYFVEEVSSSSLPKNKNGGLHTFAVGGGGPCPEGQEWDEASQLCVDVLPEPVITSVPMVNTVPIEQPVQPVVETIQPETRVKLNDNTVVKSPIINNIETNEEEINAPSKNNYVLDIQRKLKSAGYDLGKSGPNGDGVDGVMGNKTKIAEEAYNAGIPATKIKIADPKKPVIGETKNYLVNKNLKDGYLPYLNSGEESCEKGKGCSANVSIKMASLLSNVTDKSLWANDAWFNKSEILNKGGDFIYENKERDYTKMQKVPKDVWNKLQVGDYVQLNRKDTGSSAKFAAQTKPGLKNEGIEHLGFIVGKDKDGTPLVWHGSETGTAYIQRIDEPLVLHDENKISKSNTFTYQVASIVRSPVLKNADLSGLQESAYYTQLDPNKKLVPKKGATTLQSQATNTINRSVGQFKNVGYKQDDVNYVSQILIGGIMSNETEAGESKSRVLKEIGATIWKNYLGQGTSEASIGYYQLKPHLNFTNKDGSLNTIGKKLEKLGVSVDDIGNDIDSQTKAGTLLLLDIYSQLKKDKDFNTKTGLYKNKIPASYILAKSWQAGPGWYKDKKYKKYLDNFDIDYSNNALKNLGTVDVVGQNKSARNEYIKHVRPEVLKYQAQLKIYTFPGSKSLYKKDVNGNWYINKNSKSGNFVKIIDPKGIRIKNLNKFAKLKVKPKAKSKGAWYDPRTYFKEGGSVVEEGIVVEADDNDIKNYLGNGYFVEDVD